ncbi:universal stress protein [Desulfopila sp. IMCC35008]|uniref:universal stress protein n=1 Tax=Desulfopila sp. IMCC35008 TaxID=2653858 RepID=UPI0013D29CE2|nr:universal stress protein [Desulfopila sp. IMCC35008]
MPYFKKILLPVDGSISSKLAKKKAVGIALAMSAEIVLVYVTGPIPAFIVGKPREEAELAQKEEAEIVLRPFREFLGENKITYFEVIRHASNVGNEICQIAREEGCDLIVMGSRGMSDLEGLVMGSVTHRVLALCGIPVLVVR